MRTHLKTAVSILSLSLMLTAAVPVTALAASRKAPRPAPSQQGRGRDGEVIPGPIQRIVRALKNVLILEDPPTVTVDDQPTNPHP
jgi:hypothetical protein